MALPQLVIFSLTCSPEDIIIIKSNANTKKQKTTDDIMLKPIATETVKICHSCVHSVPSRPRWLQLSNISQFFSQKKSNLGKESVIGKTKTPVIDEVMVKTSAVRNHSSSPSTNCKREWMSFPFLEDTQTVKFIKEAKVIFVMRGLSGSGKSSIVQCIQSIFSHNTVCSADNYFMEEGVYNFDHEKLSSAHEYCKELAKKACGNNINVVIVDNTNVRYWEAKYYFQLASNHGYITIIASPKTPWRLNAEELAKRNKHNVDLETLESKVRMYEEFIPMYYGWFVNETLSAKLVSMGRQYFNRCLNLYPQFQEHLLKKGAFDTEKDLINSYFPQDPRRNILHCTAKYLGKGRVEGGKDYHKRTDVGEAYSKAFLITLYGFTITESTIGARIHLPPEALSLFDKPEERQRDNALSPKRESPMRSPVSLSPKRLRKKSDSGLDEWMLKRMTLSNTSPTSSQSKAVSSNSDSPDSNSSKSPITKLYPFVRPRSRGRSAHITLATAQNVQSSQTNFDVLDICDIERNACASADDFQHVLEGKARCYDGTQCCVYLDKPYNIPVLFSGYY